MEDEENAMIYVERPGAPGERTVLHDTHLDTDMLEAMRTDCTVGLGTLRDRMSPHRLPRTPWFLQPLPADKSLLEPYPLVVTNNPALSAASMQPVDLAIATRHIFSSGLVEHVRFALLREPLNETAPQTAAALGQTALYYGRAWSDETSVAGMLYNYHSDGSVEVTATLEPLPDGALRDELAGVWKELGLAAMAPLPNPSLRLVITAEQVNGVQLQALADYVVQRAN